MSDEFVIEGLEEAIKRVGALAATLDAEEVEETLLEGAGIVVSDARSRVRVKTGKLRRAIKAKRGKRPNRSIANCYAVVDFKVARHAYLVEYGSSRAPAHPYFRPAIDGTVEEVKSKVEEGLGGLLNKGGV
jgi:HK97 gp10 family phage protein